MNWTVKQTTNPSILPVSLKDMLVSAGITPSVSTTLTASASPTDTIISIASATGFSVGQTIAIGDEYGVITAINTLDLTVTPALPKAVANGSTVSYSDYNQDLLNALQASVSLIESYLNRALITQGFTYQSDNFPNARIPWWDGVKQIAQSAFAEQSFISLPRPPLVSVTSVEYYDLDNTLLEFASGNYFVDTLDEPGRIILNYSASWPINVRSAAATKIIYTAGYGSNRSDVPSAILEAIKLQAVYTFEAEPQGVSSEKIGQISFSYAAANDGIGLSLTSVVKTLLLPYRVIYA